MKFIFNRLYKYFFT